MKNNLLLSTILIITLSLFTLDVMPSTALSPSGAVLLHTSLDDIAAIESPAMGVGGSTTLAAADFVAAQTGNGANFTGAGKVAVFPAANGGTQNIELDQGEVEFWYRPNYDAGADDVIHYMLVVGQTDNVPNLILSEAEGFKLLLTDGNWNEYSTQAPLYKPLWNANQWVHIRATWDSASSDPLRLYVDNVRVDGGTSNTGWNLGAEADIGSIFVGAGSNDGISSAEGVMDELIIRDTPQVPTTATPTSTPDPDEPTNSPTATPPTTLTPTATSMPGGQTRLYLPIIIRAGTTTAATSTPTATTAAATSTPTATTGAATSTPTATTAAATSTPTPTATTSSGGGTFSPQLIDGSIVHGQGMTVVDIDQDGDQDVVVALSLTDAVYLYVNGGDSAGGGDGSNWTTVPIAADGSIVAMQTTVADFDNDNDLDIAAVGLFDRTDPCGDFCAPGEVTWYENPGNVAGSWTTHVIVEALWGARYLDASDLTGDNLPDLVVSANEVNGQGNGLYWLRNQGNGAWSELITVDAIEGGEITLAHDVDSDNVPDLIAVDRGNGAVKWYENNRTAGIPNNTPSFTAHTITNLLDPYHINLVNMDTDPALELVVTSDYGISWYDPPATPTNPWTANTIDNGFGTQQETIVAANFDGDSDIDVAVASGNAGMLGWYRNDGAGTWTWQLIQDYGGLSRITGGDINGDGRPDLVTSTYGQQAGADEITWWQNGE